MHSGQRQLGRWSKGQNKFGLEYSKMTFKLKRFENTICFAFHLSTYYNM